MNKFRFGTTYYTLGHLLTKRISSFISNNMVLLLDNLDEKEKLFGKNGILWKIRQELLYLPVRVEFIGWFKLFPLLILWVGLKWHKTKVQPLQTALYPPI